MIEIHHPHPVQLGPRARMAHPRQQLVEIGRLVVARIGDIAEMRQRSLPTLEHLLQEVFQRWQGTLPHLSYVTDAGDNETAYFDKLLSRMRHPRTGAKLNWVRVVDFYHASERLWTMAGLLFGKGRRSAAWARKMQKWLKKPGGANRVLHS